MKRIIRYTLLLIALLHILPAYAQFEPEKICRIENGRIIFTINLKWSVQEQKELSELFDLDSVLIAQVYSGKTAIELTGESWKIKKVGSNLVEVSKAISSKTDKNLKTNDIFLIIDKWMNFTGSTAESQVSLGANNFGLPYVFSYAKYKARFYLPAYKSSEKVNISGSFNDWSTTRTPMKRVDDGWMTDLNLKPGKYLYKYIVDGKWTTDPNNKLRERDGAGGYNSVVYVCNHLFTLKGFKNAKKVVVTGNFYNWNPRGIALNRTVDGWSVPVYLKDGTYAYKFLVDNQWMTDPGNHNTRKDADGNLNSFIGIGEPYLFKLDRFPTAEKVLLAGSFNNWNPVELLMDKTEKGWELPYVIAAGNYEYKFIVDGLWITDPVNPFMTEKNGIHNSFIALKANHLFELDKYRDARKVIVTGSFNNWEKNGYRMIQQGGKWILPINLKPGKYTYKFIVDDNWILDPLNKLYEQNEYNTNNSVLWIEP
jgi:1,4-alpha-glucan branching enzyme